MRPRIVSKLKSIAGVLVGEAKIRDNTSVDAVRTDRREKRQEAVEDCGVTLRRRGLIFGVSALAGSALALLSRPARAGHQGGNTFHLGTFPPDSNVSRQLTNLRRETKSTNSWALGIDNANLQTGSALRGDVKSAGIGVFGNNQSFGKGGIGVWGHCGLGVGVLGQNDSDEKSGGGYGVLGKSPNVGVKGEGNYAGVVGVSERNGVQGFTKKECGVFGQAEANGIAICGYKSGVSKDYAGHFIGNVYVKGDFLVQGQKCAVVTLSDGSHKRLYSVESTESWFEDFGEARLSKGRAKVQIDPDFAEVTQAPYHIFLTPNGKSHGLYVARKSQQSFEVREQDGGKGKVSFSYRIAARRKDIPHTRFQTVNVPKTPTLVEEPKVPIYYNISMVRAAQENE